MKPRHKAWAAGYRSGLEQSFKDICDKEGLDVKYESDSISFVQPAKKRRYTPDFKTKDGRYIETKGLFTAEDRQKMLLVKEQNPGLSILMVFKRDNPITKGSKNHYSDWCNKNGVEWCLFSDTSKWKNYIKDTK